MNNIVSVNPACYNLRGWIFVRWVTLSFITLSTSWKLIGIPALVMLDSIPDHPPDKVILGASPSSLWLGARIAPLNQSMMMYYLWVWTDVSSCFV